MIFQSKDVWIFKAPKFEYFIFQECCLIIFLKTLQLEIKAGNFNIVLKVDKLH